MSVSTGTLVYFSFKIDEMAVVKSEWSKEGKDEKKNQPH